MPELLSMKFYYIAWNIALHNVLAIVHDVFTLWSSDMTICLVIRHDNLNINVRQRDMRR